MKRKINSVVDKDGKSRLNLRLPPDLLRWVKQHCEKNNTNVTQIVVAHFTELKKKAEGYVEQF